MFLRPFLAAALYLAAAATHADSPAPGDCTTRPHCFDAILEAAREGRQMDQLALTRTLQRTFHGAPPAAVPRPALTARLDATAGVGDPSTVLQALLRNEKDVAPWLPERRRALALAYLQAGRLGEAGLELEEALADDPTQAPFWLDLAVLYARQGQQDKAVAALVVADGWSVDAAALRQAYTGASLRAAPDGMAPLFTQALRVIAINAEAQARREAGLAPLTPSRPADGKPAPMATVVFSDDCRPSYPKTALRYEDTGTVKLGFLVGADGRAVQIRKRSSSGHADLDNAALLALSGCRFRPLLAEGKPAPSWAVVEYVWTLE